jgi:PleD family two-component response regulator
MVASQLSRVGGGGKAYRVGGEEFTILFPGVTANDALPFLEDLRLRIAASRFRVRGLPDRRSASRGADRRIGAKNAVRRRNNLQPQLVDNRLSVTISIGVANARPSTPAVEQVVEAVEAADKALYRAKRAGRNRVELDADRPRSRVRRARA